MWRSGGGAEGEDEAIEAGREQEPPPREWAVEGLIPGSPAARWRFRLTWRRPWLRVWRVVRGYITAVLGAGGVGKSYVLLDLGIAALIGGTWFGLPVRRVRSVLYVDTELEGEEFRRRAYPLARGRRLNRLPRGLHYLRLTASLAEPAAAALLRETVRRTRAGLVLVDSLSIGSYTVSLNDPGSMGRVLAMLESLGPPVVLIDHMGKDRSRGAAGTWVKQAKVRCELRLERPSSVQGAGGAIRVEHSKASFGPQREPFTVQAQRIGPDPNAPTCVAFVPLIPLVAQPSGARAAPVKPAADGWDDAVAKALSPMGDKAGDGAAERGEPSPRPLPVLPVDKREAPDGGDAAERGEPEPVPEVRAGPRDDVCRRILAWVREHQPDGAAGGELVGGLIDAGVCARAPAYRHLGHLVDDGLLLREGEGVPGSPHYYRHAAPRLVGDDTPKIDERPA